MYNLAKEMYSDVKAAGIKSTRDRTLINLTKSPAIMASGISMIFLAENSNEPCDRLKFLLQQKQAANNSNIFKDKIVAIVDKFLEYKCISTKQHEQLLFKCNLLHMKKK